MLTGRGRGHMRTITARQGPREDDIFYRNGGMVFIGPRVDQYIFHLDEINHTRLLQHLDLHSGLGLAGSLKLGHLLRGPSPYRVVSSANRRRVLRGRRVYKGVFLHLNPSTITYKPWLSWLIGRCVHEINGWDEYPSLLARISISLVC